MFRKGRQSGELTPHKMHTGRVEDLPGDTSVLWCNPKLASCVKYPLHTDEALETRRAGGRGSGGPRSDPAVEPLSKQEQQQRTGRDSAGKPCPPPTQQGGKQRKAAVASRVKSVF